jgi:hypothetical protein
MYDNQLELYIKNDDTTLEGILNCLATNNWIDEDYRIDGTSISFTGGDYDDDFKVSLYSDYIFIEGNNSYEVVSMWEQLKSVAL